jgi:Mn2+/Fe2+ NRAMP family transporter
VLDRKLLRDLWAMKGQALAIAMVIGAGVTMFVTYLSNFESMQRTRAAYYADARFADVFVGVLITNVVAAFILIACAATLFATGQHDITDAAQAAQALGPIAGPTASTLFAVGLLAASLLGLGVVPLASAYTACEAFGWEQGVGWRWREAPAFYGLLAFFIGFAALFMLIPGLPLIQVMFSAQVINGLLLPVILVFVMLLAGDKRLMGNLVSGKINLALGWTVTALLIVMSLVLVVTAFSG